MAELLESLALTSMMKYCNDNPKLKFYCNKLDLQNICQPHENMGKEQTGRYILQSHQCAWWSWSRQSSACCTRSCSVSDWEQQQWILQCGFPVDQHSPCYTRWGNCRRHPWPPHTPLLSIPSQIYRSTTGRSEQRLWWQVQLIAPCCQQILNRVLPGHKQI